MAGPNQAFEELDSGGRAGPPSNDGTRKQFGRLRCFAHGLKIRLNHHSK